MTMCKTKNPCKLEIQNINELRVCYITSVSWQDYVQFYILTNDNILAIIEISLKLKWRTWKSQKCFIFYKNRNMTWNKDHKIKPFVRTSTSKKKTIKTFWFIFVFSFLRNKEWMYCNNFLTHVHIFDLSFLELLKYHCFATTQRLHWFSNQSSIFKTKSSWLFNV